jgi:hypothetical protein
LRVGICAPTSLRQACRRAEFVGLARHRRGEVAPLADVGAQVGQLPAPVVVELYELEVAGADRAVGRRAALLVERVVRVVPEQRLALQPAGPAQQRPAASRTPATSRSVG